ncbi:MAG TPA: DNA gyrase inhibitor YacG [Gammaproteobacteria bacterium]|nr:DNA gyrase inhibitor YacG [Gammaproteobacteria bacterium]
MSAGKPPVVSCPHCGKSVAWIAASEYKPFCSERCKLIDLGDWLLEKHVIVGEELPPSSFDAEQEPGT